MPDRPTPPRGSALGPIVLIALLVAAIAAAFAYTGGWFSPARITPYKLVDTIAPPGGPALGFRRNHAKGICFSGSFESNGKGGELSTAQMMASGSYPVTGRFNLATNDPKAQDGMARVRGLSLRIKTPDGQEWRSAMIDAPFFPVATTQAFYELQLASARKDDPDAMKNFAGAHPEIKAFGAWAGSAPFTGSYAEERYNGLNSFLFTDPSGQDHAVRWAFVPAAAPVAVPAAELKQRDPDFLAKEITERVGKGAQRWAMAVTVANPGDPTADPSKAWPADRRTVEVGTLVVSAIEAEPDGPCRDINFDPTVLPHGMKVSDDPFPAARSAAYSVSFNRRTAEEKDYPRVAAGEQAMSDAAVKDPRHFTPLQRALHWFMAICILAMLFIGIGMVSTIEPVYLTLVSIHKPLGIAILVLALLRLVVRLRNGAPALPRDLPPVMKLAAQLSHLAFYVLMIALPLIGWGMLSAADYPVVLLGLHLPAIVPPSASMHTLLWNAHQVLALCFFALILLHFAAALFHALVRRDGVFQAMTGGRN